MEQAELLEMILRPESAEKVLEVLDSFDLDPLTLTPVEGVGRQRGHTEIFRGREYRIETRPKLKVEVLVDSPEKREELVRRLREVVYTGHVGDGKIFFFQVETPLSPVVSD